MTYAEFMTELARVDATWHVCSDGTLRCDRGDCPITAVARAHDIDYEPHQWYEASEALELEPTYDVDVVNAADNGMQFDDEIRTDLLKACKL